MAKSKEVALKKDTTPARFAAREGDAKIGGKITAADMALPFLTILQGLSGPLKKDSPSYIKGAAIGDIYLSVLGKTWDGDEGVEIILCHYSRAYCERDPDIVTGPPINTYSPDDAIVLNTPRGEKKGKMILPNGNELQETAFHAVLVKDNGKWVRAVMPMRSTSLKVSKRLNNQVMAFEDSGEQAARWSKSWKLTSGTGTGGGNSWAVPVMTLLDWVDQETYDLARDWAITAGRLTNLAATEAAQAAKTGDNAQF